MQDLPHIARMLGMPVEVTINDVLLIVGVDDNIPAVINRYREDWNRRALASPSPETGTAAVPTLGPVEDGEWCHFCGGWSESDDEDMCTSCGDDNIVTRQYRRISVASTSAAGSAHEPKPNAGQQETLTTWALCPRCGDRVVTKFEAGPPWNGKTVFVAHAAKGSSPRVHCRESGQAPPTPAAPAPEPVKPPADLPRCRACWGLLYLENDRIADGCPCNSPRGINHGLVSKDTCTCVECDPAQTGGSRACTPVAGTAPTHETRECATCGDPLVPYRTCINPDCAPAAEPERPATPPEHVCSPACSHSPSKMRRP